MEKINPYMTVNGYTVVYNSGKFKVITKDKIDIREWIVKLPKSLIQFILDQQLPSPLEVSVLLLNEEVWWLIDAICYSPDEKIGFLTLKWLYYISK